MVMEVETRYMIAASLNTELQDESPIKDGELILSRSLEDFGQF